MWDNFANILRKLGEKSLSKIGCCVLLLARENLRLKNSYILAKTWLSAPKITRPNKLQHYFCIIINIFLYHGHKNKQKTKNIKRRFFTNSRIFLENRSKLSNQAFGKNISTPSWFYKFFKNTCGKSAFLLIFLPA